MFYLYFGVYLGLLCLQCTIFLTHNQGLKLKYINNYILKNYTILEQACK